MINFIREEKLNTTVVEEGYISPLREINNNSLDFKCHGGVFDKNLNFIKNSQQTSYDNYTGICNNLLSPITPPHTIISRI